MVTNAEGVAPMGSDVDVVAVVLEAACVGLVRDPSAPLWTARQAANECPDTFAPIAEYELTRPACTGTGANPVREMGDEFISNLRHVMNTHLAEDGQKWYVFGPWREEDESGAIVRITVACMTDEDAAEAGLYPW